MLSHIIVGSTPDEREYLFLKIKDSSDKSSINLKGVQSMQRVEMHDLTITKKWSDRVQQMLLLGRSRYNTLVVMVDNIDILPKNFDKLFDVIYQKKYTNYNGETIEAELPLQWVQVTNNKTPDGYETDVLII